MSIQRCVLRQALAAEKSDSETTSALENLGEELRILYVAMTRAKEKLILTGAVRAIPSEARGQAAELVADRRRRLEKRCPYSSLTGASSYLDWVTAGADAASRMRGCWLCLCTSHMRYLTRACGK